ncbi:DUF3499 domain-containing protein [Williamsia sp. CHRR-6]|uniref:DUF3499 domain-containing protein n=1 Tax=Williamsia sp. CHRR-6 TaxID=2835871 RepID=UPI001BD93277|nr:DUF3499 domain-containing protein [Williamsia sp. CHRR-6]MBT0565503.1 DUF3499 domain-containing protein [Williamsia sp. CHRR-6]
MRLPRQCCRPGCAEPAVATLTFVYAESIAVVGPLATADEPHSWDLCHDHASRITVPRGWEMMRSAGGFSAPRADEDDLTALAEAVREAGALRRTVRTVEAPRSVSSSPAVLDTLPSATAARPRPGRRGHLRVLPDPVD